MHLSTHCSMFICGAQARQRRPAAAPLSPAPPRRPIGGPPPRHPVTALIRAQAPPRKRDFSPLAAAPRVPSAHAGARTPLSTAPGGHLPSTPGGGRPASLIDAGGAAPAAAAARPFRAPSPLPEVPPRARAPPSGPGPRPPAARARLPGPRAAPGAVRFRIQERSASAAEQAPPHPARRSVGAAAPLAAALSPPGPRHAGGAPRGPPRPHPTRPRRAPGGAGGARGPPLPQPNFRPRPRGGGGPRRGGLRPRRLSLAPPEPVLARPRPRSHPGAASPMCLVPAPPRGVHVTSKTFQALQTRGIGRRRRARPRAGGALLAAAAAQRSAHAGRAAPRGSWRAGARRAGGARAEAL
jgi:hypothetical protein